MGEARQTIDQMTKCMENHDAAGLANLYAEDAVAFTPDAGELKGREAIVKYLTAFTVAVPDFRWESLADHESGNTAADEGWVVGTNTGPIELPDGTVIPATGRPVRVRGVDLATVENGQIVRHNFYFDQVELLTQLGLMPELGA
ncbi:MAG: ester cyclase [Acidimicrobiales bacterium]